MNCSRFSICSGKNDLIKMKTFLSLLSLVLATVMINAQTDAIRLPEAAYAQEIYDPETGTANLSYNYSGKWDLDGDQQADSLFFIGNGGVHAYFYPRIVLSSDGVARSFPFIRLDMPYLQGQEVLDKFGKNAGVQFVVYDADKDGGTDLYLNFDNPFGSLPRQWKRWGITTKHVLLSFDKGKLRVRNYGSDFPNVNTLSGKMLLECIVIGR